ncbi:phosphoribosylglycinamide formyltransferase [Altibacter sp. HG106]|uniref:phosphoribosylglycinamide formyltransferase n=1 Tax=Altibacter sp. HG106 TaxID=3023937 RepID=UPI00234FC0A0|nr:phosphoribosylglycinamide formyltransferase [Altibacter sp. HG106]MDC7994910.1 phosphoribosylglycinamide formyltransferase [Altibacter sp. HG106]
MKKRIVIFASGNGTNAKKIIEYFQSSETAEVIQVIASKKDAKVLEVADSHHIASEFIPKEGFQNPEKLIEKLQSQKVDLIVLAGFLLKIPPAFVEAFPNKIINIHPALLPKFGGKGMYGKFVHEAVAASEEKETGITIHYVNEQYDEGAIIFQTAVPVAKNDTPEQIAKKVQHLEHQHFPKVIETLLSTPNE